MRACVLSIHQTHLTLAYTVSVASLPQNPRDSRRLPVDQKSSYRFGGPSERRSRLAVSCAAAPLAALQAAPHSFFNMPTINAWAVAAAMAAFLVYRVIRFARSYVDGALLSKGPAPKEAFAGQVVWITGASQGLGAELARAFAAHGARLILSARRREQLQAVADDCRQAAGQQHCVLPFDLLGDFEELEQAAAGAAAAFGGAGVDVLVHNAGCSQHSLAEETSAEVADTMLRLNTLAPIALTRAALPAMLKRRQGRILVISSMAGRIPSPGQALYSAAKFGLNGYFQALSTEICDRDVGITICCPGPIAAQDAQALRNVMGATGMMTKAVETSAAGKNRLPPGEVARWVVAAAHHGVREAWIAKQPVLLLSYLMEHAPGLGMYVLRRIGPKRAQALKSGGSGYDVGGLLRK